MIVNALVGILFILFTALVILLVSKNKILKSIAIVIICYLAGIVVGNIGVLPESFSSVQLTIQNISVVIAQPIVWRFFERSSFGGFVYDRIIAILDGLLLHLMLKSISIAGIDSNYLE